MASDTPGQRLRLALEMFDFGVSMQRMRLRRANLDLDENAIDELMSAWMLERPGAEDGDCAGPVSRRQR